MISTYPLPEGWSEPERFEDEVEADGVRLFRVGLSARKDGLEALGAAAAADRSPVERAHFELLERVAVLEASRRQDGAIPVRTAEGLLVGERQVSEAFSVSPAPAVWAPARSNGVALHSRWELAAQAARRELFERDRVLRSWLGELTPVPVSLHDWDCPLREALSYEWSAFRFPAGSDGVVISELEVVGVFGFPLLPSVPLVFGYGARSSLVGSDGALEAASSEAMQLLSFLWGEPLPHREPPPEPTPMAHLETYQWPARHAILRAWLGGAHRKHGRPSTSSEDSSVSFLDLTPPWLAGKLHVAKAVCPAAVPLWFGLSPLTIHMPAELRMHPIP